MRTNASQLESNINNVQVYIISTQQKILFILFFTKIFLDLFSVDLWFVCVWFIRNFKLSNSYTVSGVICFYYITLRYYVTIQFSNKSFSWSSNCGFFYPGSIIFCIFT